LTQAVDFVRNIWLSGFYANEPYQQGTERNSPLRRYSIKMPRYLTADRESCQDREAHGRGANVAMVGMGIPSCRIVWWRAIGARAAHVCGAALVAAVLAAPIAIGQESAAAMKPDSVMQTGRTGTVAISQSAPALNLSVLKPGTGQIVIGKIRVHRFWDKENDWLFAGVGVSRVLDFASTANFRARGRQEILLTNSIVDNKPLFAAIEIAATGASIGASYLFHRASHHRLERWVSFVHIGVTDFGVIRNYSLQSARPHVRLPGDGTSE